MTDECPRLPERLLDPRPVLAVGTAAWLVALVVALAVPHHGGEAVALCAIGAALGGLGYGVFALQRRAVLRGHRDAQVGLDRAGDAGRG